MKTACPAACGHSKVKFKLRGKGLPPALKSVVGYLSQENDILFGAVGTP